MADKTEYEYIGDSGFSPQYGMLNPGDKIWLTKEEADSFGCRVRAAAEVETKSKKEVSK